MATLAETSLTAVELRVLDRFTRLVTDEFGPDLHGVWLYGSRARGEPPHEDSDVDVLVVVRERSGDEWKRASGLLHDAADAEGLDPFAFQTLVYTPERLAQRREIRSFFIQEVDRDKVVLAGEP